MKKILVFIFLITTLQSFGQTPLKFSELTAFAGNVSNEWFIAVVNNANRKVQGKYINKERIDSIVTAFGTYYLKTAADARFVHYTDSAAMLSPYLRSLNAAATYATISNLALKLTIADTAAMLANYRLAMIANTAGLLLKLNLSDTASILSGYGRTGHHYTKAQSDALYPTITRFLDSIISVKGLISSGGLSVDAVPTNGSTNPVQSDGTFDALALKKNDADSVNVSGYTSRGWHKRGIDSLDVVHRALITLKLSISDTAAMLANYKASMIANDAKISSQWTTTGSDIYRMSKVGVNVSPSYIFHVKAPSVGSFPFVMSASDGSDGGYFYEDPSGNYEFHVANAAGASKVVLRAANTSYFTENLAIGATSATQKFEVTGNGIFTGWLGIAKGTLSTHAVRKDQLDSLAALIVGSGKPVADSVHTVADHYVRQDRLKMVTDSAAAASTLYFATTDFYKPGTAADPLKVKGKADSATAVYLTATQTLTNKRWTARVGSTASSATPTINTDNYDVYKLTAQAAAITSFTTNLTGTPADADVLEIQITDNGTARAITWGASFASSSVTLPATTTISTTLTVIFQYYTTSSYGNNKWICTNYY